MVSSIRNNLVVLISIIFACFWGLNLEYSFKIKTIITIITVIICVTSTWALVNRWNNIVKMQYSPYQTLTLTVISSVLILIFLTKFSTTLVGWLSWLWWLSGFLCLGFLMVFISICYGAISKNIN